MASTKAHHAIGWAAGVAASSLVIKEGVSGPLHAQAVIALAAAVSGGTAPDWLELSWVHRDRRWIAHRTATHWGVGWVGLLLAAHHHLSAAAWAPAAFGFAAGAVSHLVADWGTPQGVPWIWKRHSLKLWKSGRGDALQVALAWMLALGLADRALFDGLHLAWVLGAT